MGGVCLYVCVGGGNALVWDSSGMGSSCRECGSLYEYVGGEEELCGMAVRGGYMSVAAGKGCLCVWGNQAAVGLWEGARWRGWWVWERCLRNNNYFMHYWLTIIIIIKTY